MSSSPTLSAPNTETQTWLFLTGVEIDRARPYGRVRRAELGEILYRPGEVRVPCLVLYRPRCESFSPVSTENG